MSLIVSHDAFQTLVRTFSEIPEPDSVDFRRTAHQELPGEAGCIAGHPAERTVRECPFFSGLVMPTAGSCRKFAGVVLCRALIHPTNFATVRSRMDIPVRRQAETRCRSENHRPLLAFSSPT